MKILICLLIIQSLYIFPSNKEQINIFLDIKSCFTCENSIISSIENKSNNKDIEFNLYLTNLRNNQYQPVYKKVKNIFPNTNIIIDSNSLLTKTNNLKEFPLITYFVNDLILFKDNSLLNTKVFDFVNFNRNLQNINDTEKPIFDLKSAAYFNEFYYFIDDFDKNIKVFNKNLFYVKSINYDKLKWSLINNKKNTKDSSLINIYIKKLHLENNRIYAISELPYIDDYNQINFKLVLIDLETLVISDFYDNDRLSYYGYYVAKLNNNKYFAQVYDNNYHHTRHNETKGVSTIFAVYQKDSLSNLLSIENVEELTNRPFTYGMPTKFSVSNDDVIILNEFQSLFGILSIKNNSYDYKKIIPEGVLESCLSNLKQANCFDIMNHKGLNFDRKYGIMDLSKGKSYFIIKFYTLLDKSFNSIINHKLTFQGEFIEENSYELFKLNDDEIISIIPVISNNNISYILEYRNKGYKLLKVE